MALRRKDRLPCGTFERRQFHSLSDVRREMVTLYWQAKAGKIDKGIAPSLVKLLDMIAHFMVETDAERAERELREKIEELRQQMIAHGIDVPPVIDAVPERVS
jgi:hypothetical protein